MDCDGRIGSYWDLCSSDNARIYFFSHLESLGDFWDRNDEWDLVGQLRVFVTPPFDSNDGFEELYVDRVYLVVFE